MVVIKKKIVCPECTGTGELMRKKATNLPKLIIGALYRTFHQHFPRVHEMELEQGWRADFVTITKSGYTCEYEVKISLSDFKKDFTKERKHSILKKREAFGLGSTNWHGSGGLMSPNRFAYVIPKELEEKILPLLPDYAGLYTYSGSTVFCIVTPPLLHKEKDIPAWTDRILKACCYRISSSYGNYTWDENEKGRTQNKEE